jgi:hypothetical protein
MKKQLYILVLLAALLLGLAACQETAAPEATATLRPTAAVPTATVPPVASPTIVIPAATDTPTPPPAEAPTPAPPTVTPAPVGEVSARPMPRFASFSPRAVNVEPAIVHEPIAPDLSNVIVPFAFSEDQLARLAASGIVVSPGVEKEFFTVYEQARYANVPIFVTSDSLLHSYHLIFDKVLRTAERQYFIPLLQDLNLTMLAQTDYYYQQLRGTAWEDAARRSVAFIGVGCRLLDSTVTIPGYAEDLVDAELALIDDAAGIRPSPLFPGLEFGEDYTQYIPRGHYTLSDELEAYFRSMMWYGRMTFRLTTRDPEVGKAETRSALLLVYGLQQASIDGRPALDAWLDLYNPTAFMVGRSDDLTALQYIDVMNAVYGEAPTLAAVTDEARLDVFIELANELPPPQILGLVISDVMEEEETTKGFRFMGQRFVPDAYIFRQLIYRNVGTRENSRGLPKGLDVMAAIGSERAYTILDELGETSYVNYPEQMAKVRAWTSSLTAEEWTETLYNGWLYTLQPLLDEPGAGYPQFMQTDAWLDKQLNTSLGSWAELKHDTILYAKQVYAELGGGGPQPPQPLPAAGYVEPVPEFYARLAALARMTQDGLSSRGLLSENEANSLSRLIQLADAFQLMAEKELRGEPLTEEEQHLIRYYGGELEHLVMASGDIPDEDPFGQPYMDEEPQAAVIADVATDPDPNRDGSADPIVLEEAVGRIDEIYVVVPAVAEDGTIFLEVAKGGVFSYYEFPWPADDRLTDEKWREMLETGTAPDRPVWIGTFFTEQTEYAEIQEAVYNFQKAVTLAYWARETPVEWPAELRAVYAPDLTALREAGQYVGHQWVTATYRSFDLQTENRAVVTVRETWDDTLYELVGEYQEFEDPVLGQRGPYTLDVTYTLEREVVVWRVVRAVYANQQPAWQ